MQTLTAAPRDHLTADQVRQIVAGNITVDIGADLLDTDGQYLDDLTADLQPSGHIEHRSHRVIHRTCRMQLARELQWGAVRIRPWMTLASGGLTMKAYLGVFLLETPTMSSGEEPRTWTVEGYDLLAGLNGEVGRTYRVAAGTRVGAAVEQAVADSGLTVTVNISGSGDSPAIPNDMTWSVRDDVTWLRVVNDLLAAGGYRAAYVSAAGSLRSEPYLAPSARPTEWNYDADAADTTVGVAADVEKDLWGVPNTWVFYVDDPAQGEPVEGSTMYTVVNQSDGLTSIDNRGRTVVAKRALEAADYTSLVSQGDQLVEQDRQVVTKAKMTVGPNPLHGHFDIVDVAHPDAGVTGRWQVSSWRLPLDGSDMDLEARSVE